MNVTPRVMVVAADATRQRELVATLEAGSYQAEPHSSPAAGRESLSQSSPHLIVVDLEGVAQSEFMDLRRAARDVHASLLVVTSSPEQMTNDTVDADDWLTWDRIAAELNARVARFSQRRAVPLSLADPRFLALIVHDLRTPLNVFTLTIRALSQSVKAPTPDFEEDLTFLLENAKQIERMLAQLGDYSRLIEARGKSTTAVEFQTRRFLVDFLEEKQMKRDSEFKGVRIEMTPDMPEVVELDPVRARLALHHALANATAAVPEAPIRLRSGGSATEWVLEVIVDKPAPTTVSSTMLQPDSFERLVGSNAERRGFDLAIAALVSQSFHGSAHLEIEPATRSIIRLTWPTQATTEG